MSESQQITRRGLLGTAAAGAAVAAVPAAAEAKTRKAKVRRLEEDNAIRQAAAGLLRLGELDDRNLIMHVIDEQRSHGTRGRLGLSGAA